VLACLTDVVDGHLARSRGQVTDFGVMADPIADKALVGPRAARACRCSGALPWWATAGDPGPRGRRHAMRSRSPGTG
jgi:CDP-diacylglycerol--glycerol-3-phosphate 3-phosphatidyltransferase